jgi:hypothetical protein
VWLQRVEGLADLFRPPYVKGDVEGYEVAPGEEEV